VLLLTVPLALLVVVGLLALASYLERGGARVLVRMTVRSSASPEATEALVASELAPVLAAQGLTDRRERRGSVGDDALERELRPLAS
jgi:hypothetical protein